MVCLGTSKTVPEALGRMPPSRSSEAVGGGGGSRLGVGCLGSPSFLHATLYPSPQQVISQSQPQSQFLNAEERRRPPSSLTTHQSSPSSVRKAKGIDRLQVWPQPALLSHHYCFLPCPTPLTPTLPPVCLYDGQRLHRPTVTSVKWAEET